MGGSKSVTVGYRYYFGLHMGYGWGPHDEIVAFKVADRVAWQTGQPILAPIVNTTVLGLPVYTPNPADPMQITASGAYYIRAPLLFGGDKAEGGIEGTLDVYMGESSQSTVGSRLATMLGGLVPGFRRRTTVFFDGQISAMNPYPKPWKVRLRRNLAGWDGAVWNSADCIINLASGAIRARNPAHILYECCTNRSWGRGLSSSMLNLPSFEAAADTLVAEQFGMCIRWNRQDKIAEFTQHIQNTIGSAMYPDPVTGLITLKLIRGDYDPEDLPLFDPDSGLLGIEDDDNAAPAAGTNEVIVRYKDPRTGEWGQVRTQNTAAIQSVNGARATETVEYPGIPTPELALRVAQRDLKAKSGFIKRFRVRLDRRGYLLTPGSAFRVSDPSRGIQEIILRAMPVGEGGPTNGEIVIQALQDQFGLPAASFTQPQTSQHVTPSLVPLAIATRSAIEVPYREIVRNSDPANAEIIASTAGFLGALALKPQPLATAFLMATRIGASGDFAARNTGSFCPTATLSFAMARAPAPVVVTLTNVVNLELVQPGSAALVDNEICRVDAIDLTAGQVTLARGCADTLPAAHAGGARIWFFEDFMGLDVTEYTVGNSVQVRMLTQTSGGQLDVALAGTNTVVMGQRQFRPYPPGNLLVNGSAYPTSISGDLSLVWFHRDRLLQDDQLIDATPGNIGPEAGTTYTVRIFSGAGGTVLERTVSGIAATTFVYLAADEIADGGPFNPLRFTLNSVRDGVESIQGYDLSVTRV